MRYGETTLEPSVPHRPRRLHARPVWQPTLEHFLLIQMCHVRVQESSACGTAPVTSTTAHGAGRPHHSTDTCAGCPTSPATQPGEPGPGLEPRRLARRRRCDLRVESQADTDLRAGARLRAVPRRLRQHHHRPDDAWVGNPPARRQARRAAADSARRALGGRRYRRSAACIAASSSPRCASTCSSATARS